MRNGKAGKSKLNDNSVESLDRISGFKAFEAEPKRIEILMVIQRDLTKLFNSAWRLNDRFSKCVEALLRLPKINWAGIYFMDNSSETLHLSFSKGSRSQFIDRVLCLNSDSTFFRLVKEGNPIYTQLHELDGSLKNENKQKGGLDALAIIPFYHMEEVQGCLTISLANLGEIPFVILVLESIAAQISTTTTLLRAEEELNLAKAEKNGILEASTDEIRLIDSNMRIVWTNKSDTQKTDADVESISDKLCYQTYFHRNKPCIGCPAKEALITGKMANAVLFQPDLSNKKPEAFWAVNIVPVTNDSDDPANFIEIVRDISKPKAVEKALREREVTLNAIFSASPVGIGLARNRVLDWANKTLDHMLGYKEGDLLGKSSRLLYQDTKEYERVGCELYSNAKDGIGQVETVWIRKDGKMIDCFVQGSLLEPDDPSKGLIVVAMDITERKKVERALSEQISRNELILKTTTDGLFIMDMKGKIFEVNPASEMITGYSKEELVGKEIRNFDINENFKEHIKRILRKKHDRFETKLQHKNRKILDVEVSTTFLDTANNKFFFSFFRDISEKKKAERKLIEREKELETKSNNLEEANTALKVLLKKRDEDKSELEEKVLSNVKELLTPYLEKLNRSGLNDTQKAYVEILERNLNDIISPFSRRLSSTYLKFTPAEMQVANLVKHGRTSKEIAEILNLSNLTIASHRKSIRKKIGITRKKGSLRTHLLSLQQEEKNWRSP
jgi:PAS domain S-box-containing protein